MLLLGPWPRSLNLPCALVALSLAIQAVPNSYATSDPKIQPQSSDGEFIDQILSGTAPFQKVDDFRGQLLLSGRVDEAEQIGHLAVIRLPNQDARETERLTQVISDFYRVTDEPGRTRLFQHLLAVDSRLAARRFVADKQNPLTVALQIKNYWGLEVLTNERGLCTDILSSRPPDERQIRASVESLQWFSTAAYALGEGRLVEDISPSHFDLLLAAWERLPIDRRNAMANEFPNPHRFALSFVSPDRFARYFLATIEMQPRGFLRSFIGPKSLKPETVSTLRAVVNDSTQNPARRLAAVQILIDTSEWSDDLTPAWRQIRRAVDSAPDVTAVDASIARMGAPNRVRMPVSRAAIDEVLLGIRGPAQGDGECLDRKLFALSERADVGALVVALRDLRHEPELSVDGQQRADTALAILASPPRQSLREFCAKIAR